MKRHFFIIFLLCMACSIGAYADDEVEWDSVSTASEFYSKIKANNSANIKLTADIDLTSHSSDDGCIFNITFSGRINGSYTTDDGQTSYHALKNSKEHLLFNKLTNAEISEIIVQDCTFDGWDTHSGWLGAEATNCTFKYIILSNVDGTATATGIDYDCMGGLIGEASGCTFDHIVAMDVDILSDGYMAGCIVGKATDNCKFTNILVNMLCSVYADGNTEWSNVKDAAYAGGICGYSESCSFNKCNVLGLITGEDDRLGGIVGFGKSTSIIDCNNYGLVTHLDKDDYITVRDKITAYCANKMSTSANLYSDYSVAVIYTTLAAGVAAGIVYVALDSVYISAQLLGLCTGGTFFIVELAVIPIIIYIAQDPDEVGGIAGHLQEGSSAIGCTNNGYIRTSDAYAGGIVGYLKSSSAIDCCNRGIVNGQQQTGGIVGMNDNGKIISCLNLGGLAVYEESVTGREIQGDSDGTVTVTGNCYTSNEDGTSTSQKAVSQQSLASGSVAAYLNANTTQSDKRWTQMIGTNIYPSPTAILNDTTAITESDIDATASYIYKASNASEFVSAALNPAVNIELTGDIDLESNSYITLCGTTPFCGAIYGNGYTIKNNAMSATELSDWDTDNDNQALFSSAKNAKFDNIILDNFKMTQYEGSQTVDSKHTEAFLVGTSNNSCYSNITVRNSSITRDDSYLAEVGGIVSISNNDSITNCTMESTCKLQGYSGWKCTDTNVGGIAAKAYGTVFTQCWNAGSIWADDDQDGGIAGYASGCTFDRCLNTGGITAQEEVGGICGNGYNSVFTRCVNTSWISDDDNTREDRRAGIVGYLHGSGASISQCLNFGAINYADDDCGALEGCAKDGAKSAKNTNSFYYCGYNNGHVDNQSEYSDESIFRIAKIQSGEFAYKSTVDEAGEENWLYQSIDNNNGFSTTYPVPIPSAGTVYSNILCDGTQSYSNKYQSTEAHTSEIDMEGYCIYCGSYFGDGDLHIKNAAYLCEFSKAVNNGKDYSSYTIYLEDDIDMSGADFTPIGTSDYPFTGTFDGQGHRIKNLTINNTTGYSGLFGYVGGLSTTGNKTYIKNVIIDSSCSITSTGKGVAGLVGAVTSLGYVFIQNCGNEANVSGSGNVAGLVGGMYGASVSSVSTLGVHLNVANSYNTGNITATIQSGTLCGLATVNCSIENCYNTGTISCNDKSSGLVYSSTKSYNITNSYDINGAQCDGVTQITADQAHSGYLCQKLNSSSTVFTQELCSDTIPIPGTEGLKYTRTTPYKWGAIVLPYDVTISEDDPYAFYQIASYTLRDSTIYLTQMTGSLPAGTPAILCLSDSVKNAETDYYEYTWTCSGDVTTTINNPAEVDNLQLTGTFTDLDISDVEGYVLRKNTVALISIASLKESDGSVICPAYEAYIAGTPIIVGGDKKSFEFLNYGFSGESEGIENVEADQTTLRTAISTGIYDITGRKLNNLQQGINIVKYSNGTSKKIVIQ